MAYIPPEIHRLIIPYLNNRDLQNIRLTSKTLADLGAETLFKMLAFHASRQSVNRILKVATHARFRTYVEALIWDTNLWNVNVSSYDDWVYFLKGIRQQLDILTWGLNETSELQLDTTETFAIETGYELYMQRQQEEHEMTLKYLCLGKIERLISRFPNLKDFCIMNGEFEYGDRAIVKTSFQCKHTLPQDLYPRGMALHDRNTNPVRPGIDAFFAIMRAKDVRFTTLRADVLHFDAFDDRDAIKTLPLATCNNLTSLDLTITIYNEQHVEWDTIVSSRRNRNLKLFLELLPNLQSLSLDFERRQYPHEAWSRFAPGNIDEALPLHSAKLDSLSLSYFDTSADALLRFLTHHAPSLRALTLKDMGFTIGSDWALLFERLGEVLHLECATFAGEFYNNNGADTEEYEEPEYDGWCLDGRLGTAVAKYLIDGGDCPLTVENSMDPEGFARRHGYVLTSDSDTSSDSDSSSDSD